MAELNETKLADEILGLKVIMFKLKNQKKNIFFEVFCINI